MRYICILFVFFTLFSEAQQHNFGIIKGLVFDAETNTPLVNATLVIDKFGFGSTTDKNGRFKIDGISPAIHELSAHFLGYKTVTMNVNVESGKTKSIRFFLKSTSISKQEIVVISESAEMIKNQPMRIQLIGKSELENTPAANITDVLDFVSGVNVSATEGIFSSKSIVSMRGLSGNDQSRVLVIVDGIPLNKSDGGSVNWNLLNKDRIKEIKIYKGPGQAKYGSGAMGGIIEIETQKPNEAFAGTLKTEYGTYNTFGGAADFSGRISLDSTIGKLFWGLNTSMRISDGYISEAEEFIEVDSIMKPSFLKEYSVSGKLGFSPDDHSYAEVNINYFDDKRGNGVQVFDEYGAFSEHDTFYGMAKYVKHSANYRFDINVYSLIENYDRLYEYMNEGEYKLYDVDALREDFGSTLNCSYTSFYQHKLFGGINIKSGRVDATDTYYTSTDIIKNAGAMNTYSAYLQDKIQLINNKIQINIGLRFDYAKYYDGLFRIDYPSYSIAFMEDYQDTLSITKNWQALTPKFSIHYRFSDDKRIYFSAGRGFRAPILDDLCRSGKKRGTFKVANPDLNPEYLDNFEIGGDLQILPQISLSASVYYSLGRDFMYYVSTGDSVNMGYKITPILQKNNISKVKIIGFETDVEWTLIKSLKVFANYSYSYSEILDYEFNDKNVDIDLSGKHLTDVPNHKASAGIVFHNHKWITNLSYKFVGKRWINDANEIDDYYLLTDQYDAYSLFSLKVERHFLNSFTVGMDVNNIFDNIYISDGSKRSPGRMMFVRMSYSF